LASQRANEVAKRLECGGFSTALACEAKAGRVRCEKRKASLKTTQSKRFAQPEIMSFFAACPASGGGENAKCFHLMCGL